MSERVPPKYSENRRQGTPIGWCLVGLGLVLAGAVLFVFNPAQSGFYPFCLFHRTTGLLCPGCGSLRALHQLLHGNIVMALRCNAVLVLCLPVVCWLGIQMLRRRLQRAAPTTVKPLWIWTGFGVLVIFSVLRNLPLAQLAWLSP
jgi:hypothetical protein